MVVDEDETGERKEINVDREEKQPAKPAIQAATGAEPKLRSLFPETWLFVDSVVG